MKAWRRNKANALERLWQFERLYAAEVIRFPKIYIGPIYKECISTNQYTIKNVCSPPHSLCVGAAYFCLWSAHWWHSGMPSLSCLVMETMRERLSLYIDVHRSSKQRQHCTLDVVHRWPYSVLLVQKIVCISVVTFYVNVDCTVRLWFGRSSASHIDVSRERTVHSSKKREFLLCMQYSIEM